MKSHPYKLREGDKLECGNVIRRGTRPDLHKKSYVILDERSDAESTGFSYAAMEHADGKPTKRQFFIKTPKLALGLSDSETKNYLNDVYQAFLSEYQNRHRFENNPNVVKAEALGTYEIADKHDKRPFLIPFLVQEYVAGQTLFEYLDRDQDGKPNRVESAQEFFSIAKEIVKAVKRIHNQQVVHGDIRPNNIRLEKVGQKLLYRIVGFARSFLLDQAFHTSGGKLPAHPYRAPECVTSKTYWYTPADIYSLGGVLYYLVTGDNPPEAVPDVKQLKNTILRNIKAKNPELYRQNEGIIKVIDKCMRFNPEERYAYAESVYSALQTFDYSYQSHVDIPTLKDALAAVKKKSESLVNDKSTFFGNIILQKLSLLREGLEAIENGHYEIYGDREEIIDSLVRYLSVLEPGDQYLTVTKPAFWTPQNLGINGRFLTMNKVMATKGVIVRRVFLLTEEETRKDSDRKCDLNTFEILSAHKQATEDMAKVHRVEVDKYEIPPLVPPAKGSLTKSFYTGYRILTKEEIEAYEKEVSHVALWRKSNGDQMSILFISRPTIPTSETAEENFQGDRIVKVRFWKSERHNKLLSEIQDQLNKSKPIQDLWAEEKK